MKWGSLARAVWLTDALINVGRVCKARNPKGFLVTDANELTGRLDAKTTSLSQAHAIMRFQRQPRPAIHLVS